LSFSISNFNEEVHVNNLNNPFEVMLNDKGPVEKRDLLNRENYEEKRSELLAYGRSIKEKLRISLGASFSLLFETRVTAWLQIQEELRWIAAPAPNQIAEILERYNPRVPDKRSFSARLFVDTGDPDVAHRILRTTNIESLNLQLTFNGSRFEARSLEEKDGSLEPVTYLRFSENPGRSVDSPNLIQWSAPHLQSLIMPGYMVSALVSVLEQSAESSGVSGREKVAPAPAFALSKF
jgi:hypothetical protein